MSFFSSELEEMKRHESWRQHVADRAVSRVLNTLSLPVVERFDFGRDFFGKLGGKHRCVFSKEFRKALGNKYEQGVRSCTLRSKIIHSVYSGFPIQAAYHREFLNGIRTGATALCHMAMTIEKQINGEEGFLKIEGLNRFQILMCDDNGWNQASVDVIRKGGAWHIDFGGIIVEKPGDKAGQSIDTTYAPEGGRGYGEKDCVLMQTHYPRLIGGKIRVLY